MAIAVGVGWSRLYEPCIPHEIAALRSHCRFWRKQVRMKVIALLDYNPEGSSLCDDVLQVVDVQHPPAGTQADGHQVDAPLRLVGRLRRQLR